jgi:hypothetical protein
MVGVGIDRTRVVHLRIARSVHHVGLSSTRWRLESGLLAVPGDREILQST